MKIGIVTTWFERGAAYVSKQYEELLNDKHEVYIYARGGEEYAVGDPVWDRENVYWGKKYPMPVSPTYVDKKDFIRWLQEKSIETVLFNEQDWWQTILICKKFGVKTGGYIDYYTESTVKLFDSYDFLLCNTKRHYSVFSNHPQCYYIPWGTDVGLFAPKKSNNEVLTYFHSAGMNPHRKGTDLVIKAFDILAREYSDMKLIIHTQAKIHQYFPNLKDVVNRLIRTNQLEIIEKTIGAPGLYYLGDVYVYPSRLEGIGLTMAEALSCGLPLISSDNPPMNEFKTRYSAFAKIDKFSRRGDNYYWPECEVNIDDLKNKMQYFIINKSQIDDIKRRTREESIDKFNWKNNKKTINQIFLESKIIPLKEETIKLINKTDNSRFPYITKFTLVYKHLYKFIKLLR